MIKYSLDKSKIKVLLLEGIHENALGVFRENGYSNIECFNGAFSGTELEKKLQETHIIGIRSRTEIRRSRLSWSSKLFAIGCFSIGTNQVDIRDAKFSGIPVFNAPFSNTRSVAELVIADNGKGFDTNTVHSESLGLGIMKDRAKGVGAELEIQSKPGSGSKIIVRLKMRDEEANK